MNTNSSLSGRIWKFGDDINTEILMPSHAVTASLEEQVLALFSATRPEWSAQVRPGDFVVAGKNFGIGSSRPAARSLKAAGIRCLIAESINGLFFRNCVNFGLLALECEGVTGMFQEGQTGLVQLSDFSITNPENGATRKAGPIPDALLQIIHGGGIFPLLESDGSIAGAAKK